MIIKQLTYISCVFILMASPLSAVFGNEYIDSLNNELTKIDSTSNPKGWADVYIAIASEYFYQDQYNTAYTTFQNALNFSEQHNLEENIIDIKLNISRLVHRKGDNQLALNMLKEIYPLIDQDDLPLKGRILRQMGSNYVYLGRYSEAYEVQHEAYEAYVELKDTGTIARMLFDLGNNFFYQKQFDKSLEYFTQVLNICEASDIKDGIFQAYNAIGSIYDAKKEYDLALDYNTKGLALAIELGDISGIAWTKASRAPLLDIKGDHQQALTTFDEALKIAIETGERPLEGYIYEGKANIYKELNEFDKAIVFFKKSFEIASSNNDRSNLTALYKNIADLYYKKGNLEQYKAYTDKYQVLNDSLFNEKMIGDMSNLEERYRVQQIKQENEIKLLTKNKQIDRIRSVASIGIGVVLLGLIGFLLRFNRIRAKNNQLLRQKNVEIQEQYVNLKASNQDRRVLNDAQRIGNVGSWVYDFDKEAMKGSKHLLNMMNISLNVRDIYQPFMAFIPEELKQQIQDNIAEPSIDNQPIDYTFSIVNNDTTYWYTLRANMLLDEIIGNQKFVGTLQDITARKEKEEQITELLGQLQIKNEELESKSNDLLRSNQDLEQFAYVASHDLQEPLRTVGSFVQLFEEEYYEQVDEEGKMYVNLIVDGVKRMQVLIQDLLAYSKVGRTKFDLVAISSQTIIEEKLADLALRIEETGAEITLENTSEIITCAPSQLSIVFYNLINNGIKFNKSPQPTIHINCESRPEDWLFTIKDNGIGIDPKNHLRIFEIFKRLHRKEEFKGTGIGLALVKRIIDLHRGEIWLESALGKGTTFFFTIPKIK